MAERNPPPRTIIPGKKILKMHQLGEKIKTFQVQYVLLLNHYIPYSPILEILPPSLSILPKVKQDGKSYKSQ